MQEIYYIAELLQILKSIFSSEVSCNNVLSVIFFCPYKHSSQTFFLGGGDGV